MNKDDRELLLEKVLNLIMDDDLCALTRAPRICLQHTPLDSGADLEYTRWVVFGGQQHRRFDYQGDWDGDR